MSPPAAASVPAVPVPSPDPQKPVVASPLEKTVESNQPNVSQPLPPEPDTGDKPKIGLRITEDTFKPRPVSLPILESPAPAVDADVPILLPMEEGDEQPAISPAPVKQPPAPKIVQPPIKPKPLQPAARQPVQPPAEETPVLAPRITIQPSAQPQSIAVAKDRPVDSSASMCEIHGLVVTHHCMQCQKPLCMECVHQNGYYCSAACKKTYQKNLPRSQRSKEGSGVDKMMELCGKFKVPVILLLVAWGAYYVYANFVGCYGKVTLDMPVQSEGKMFHLKMVEPDVVVYQANDELHMAKVSSQQEIWRTDLRPLEEPNMHPKYLDDYDYDTPRNKNKLPSTEMVPSKERDRLKLLDVHKDNVVVASSRQLLVFNAKDGKLKWKYFEQDKHVQASLVHDSGILTTVSSMFAYALSFTNAARPSTVNFSFADGSQTWSMTKGGNIYGDAEKQIVHNGNLVMLGGSTGGYGGYYAYQIKVKAKPRPKSGQDSKSSKSSKSKPKAKKGSGKRIDDFMAEEGGVPMGTGDLSDMDDDEEYETVIDEAKVPAGNYTLDFISLSDGTTAAQKTLNLTTGGHAEKIGDHLYVIAGAELLAYDKGFDPMWQKKLPGFITSLAAGGDTIVAKTSKGVVALDLKTGQQQWVNNKLPRGVKDLHVAPDGAVYATLELRKADATEGEVADYRKMLISTAGRPFPFSGMFTLVKLDAKTGKTAWGDQFIGSKVFFSENGLYVVDTHEPMNMLSAISTTIPDMSLRCVSTRSGADNWRYIVKGELFYSDVVGKKFFIVYAPEPQPATGTFHLQYVEHKWW